MKKNWINILSDKVINSLLINGVITISDIEAYRFGVEILILKMVHVVSYIFIAVMMGKLPEFIIIFSVLCIFRRSTGGFHASTRLGCYFFSCSTVVIAIWLCSTVTLTWTQHVLVLILLLLMNGCAPIRNLNRRADDEEISCFKRKLKCESGVFIIVYIFCLIINIEHLAFLLFIGILMNTVLTVLGKIQSAIIIERGDRIKLM